VDIKDVLLPLQTTESIIDIPNIAWRYDRITGNRVNIPFPLPGAVLGKNGYVVRAATVAKVQAGGFGIEAG
jgi:hypothetical protein